MRRMKKNDVTALLLCGAVLLGSIGLVLGREGGSSYQAPDLMLTQGQASYDLLDGVRFDKKKYELTVCDQGGFDINVPGSYTVGYALTPVNNTEAPETAQPGSQPEEPVTPVPEEPSAPQPEGPAAPSPEEPSAPQPEGPAAPSPEEPSAPQPEEPAAPSPENPSASQPEEKPESAPEEPSKTESSPASAPEGDASAVHNSAAAQKAQGIQASNGVLPLSHPILLGSCAALPEENGPGQSPSNGLVSSEAAQSEAAAGEAKSDKPAPPAPSEEPAPEKPVSPEEDTAPVEPAPDKPAPPADAGAGQQKPEDTPAAAPESGGPSDQPAPEEGDAPPDETIQFSRTVIVQEAVTYQNIRFDVDSKADLLAGMAYDKAHYALEVLDDGGFNSSRISEYKVTCRLTNTDSGQLVADLERYVWVTAPGVEFNAPDLSLSVGQAEYDLGKDITYDSAAYALTAADPEAVDTSAEGEQRVMFTLTELPPEDPAAETTGAETTEAEAPAAGTPPGGTVKSPAEMSPDRSETDSMVIAAVFGREVRVENGLSVVIDAPPLVVMEGTEGNHNLLEGVTAEDEEGNQVKPQVEDRSQLDQAAVEQSAASRPAAGGETTPEQTAGEASAQSEQTAGGASAQSEQPGFLTAVRSIFASDAEGRPKPESTELPADLAAGNYTVTLAAVHPVTGAVFKAERSIVVLGDGEERELGDGVYHINAGLERSPLEIIGRNVTVHLSGTGAIGPGAKTGSAIDVAQGSALTLILEPGADVTLTGRDAAGSNGAGAAVHVPAASVLHLKGTGRLTARGGSGAAGDATAPGGGAGAGIGGNGGSGAGSGGAAGAVYLYTGRDRITAEGGNGGGDGKAGSPAAGIGGGGAGAEGAPGVFDGIVLMKNGGQICGADASCGVSPQTQTRNGLLGAGGPADPFQGMGLGMGQSSGASADVSVTTNTDLDLVTGELLPNSCNISATPWPVDDLTAAEPKTAAESKTAGLELKWKQPEGYTIPAGWQLDGYQLLLYSNPEGAGQIQPDSVTEIPLTAPDGEGWNTYQIPADGALPAARRVGVRMALTSQENPGDQKLGAPSLLNVAINDAGNAVRLDKPDGTSSSYGTLAGAFRELKRDHEDGGLEGTAASPSKYVITLLQDISYSEQDQAALKALTGLNRYATIILTGTDTLANDPAQNKRRLASIRSKKPGLDPIWTKIVLPYAADSAAAASFVIRDTELYEMYELEDTGSKLEIGSGMLMQYTNVWPSERPPQLNIRVGDPDRPTKPDLTIRSGNNLFITTVGMCGETQGGLKIALIGPSKEEVAQIVGCSIVDEYEGDGTMVFEHVRVLRLDISSSGNRSITCNSLGGIDEARIDGSRNGVVTMNIEDGGWFNGVEVTPKIRKDTRFIMNLNSNGFPDPGTSRPQVDWHCNYLAGFDELNVKDGIAVKFGKLKGDPTKEPAPSNSFFAGEVRLGANSTLELGYDYYENAFNNIGSITTTGPKAKLILNTEGEYFGPLAVYGPNRPDVAAGKILLYSTLEDWQRDQEWEPGEPGSGMEDVWYGTNYLHPGVKYLHFTSNPENADSGDYFLPFEGPIMLVDKTTGYVQGGNVVTVQKAGGGGLDWYASLAEAMNAIGNSAGEYTVTIRDMRYTVTFADERALATQGENASRITLTGGFAVTDLDPKYWDMTVGNNVVAGASIGYDRYIKPKPKGELDLNAPTVIRDIRLSFAENTNSVYANGHELIVGPSVYVDGRPKFYGGAKDKPVASTNMTLLSGKYGGVYGGGQSAAATVTGNASVTFGGDAELYGPMYGGGKDGSVTGTASLNITGGRAMAANAATGAENTVAGGGENGDVGGASVTITGGTANGTIEIGGCDRGSVKGAVNISVEEAAGGEPPSAPLANIHGASLRHDGAHGTVAGNIHITITNGRDYGTIHGGRAEITGAGNTSTVTFKSGTVQVRDISDFGVLNLGKENAPDSRCTLALTGKLQGADGDLNFWDGSILTLLGTSMDPADLVVNNIHTDETANRSHLHMYKGPAVPAAGTAGVTRPLTVRGKNTSMPDNKLVLGLYGPGGGVGPDSGGTALGAKGDELLRFASPANANTLNYVSDLQGLDIVVGRTESGVLTGTVEMGLSASPKIGLTGVRHTDGAGAAAQLTEADEPGKTVEKTLRFQIKSFREEAPDEPGGRITSAYISESSVPDPAWAEGGAIPAAGTAVSVNQDGPGSVTWTGSVTMNITPPVKPAPKYYFAHVRDDRKQVDSIVLEVHSPVQTKSPAVTRNGAGDYTITVELQDPKPEKPLEVSAEIIYNVSGLHQMAWALGTAGDAGPAGLSEALAQTMADGPALRDVTTLEIPTTMSHPWTFTVPAAALGTNPESRVIYVYAKDTMGNTGVYAIPLSENLIDVQMPLLAGTAALRRGSGPRLLAPDMYLVNWSGKPVKAELVGAEIPGGQGASGDGKLRLTDKLNAPWEPNELTLLVEKAADWPGSSFPAKPVVDISAVSPVNLGVMPERTQMNHGACFTFSALYDQNTIIKTKGWSQCMLSYRFTLENQQPAPPPAVNAAGAANAKTAGTVNAADNKTAGTVNAADDKTAGTADKGGESGGR